MGCSYSEALACSCLMGSTKCEVAGEPAVQGSQHAIRFPAPSLEGRQALSCMMQQLLHTHGQAHISWYSSVLIITPSPAAWMPALPTSSKIEQLRHAQAARCSSLSLTQLCPLQTSHRVQCNCKWPQQKLGCNSPL